MPVPDRRHAVERHLLRDDAYRAIREAIVAGTLAPGEALNDAALCRWLGLSRTPVRAALVRLVDDGLIETVPQRYTRVAPLRRAESGDLFQLVGALHALATELAVPRLSPRTLALLRRENDQFVHALRARDRGEAHAADARFHDVFVRESGNGEIPSALDRVTPRICRLQQLMANALPGRRSVAQHEAIMGRAAAGDALGAASAVRENWITIGAVIDRSLAEGGIAD